MLSWLEIMGLSVSKLDFNTHHMLISALLSYSWDFPEPVNIKFKELLLRLMSSDALFTTPCLEAALSSMIIRGNEPMILMKISLRFSNNIKRRYLKCAI